MSVGVGFEFAEAQARPRGSLSLPADPDVELLAPPAPCLPSRCPASPRCHNGLNPRNCKPVAIRCFSFIKVAMVKVSLHRNRHPKTPSSSSVNLAFKTQALLTGFLM